MRRYSTEQIEKAKQLRREGKTLIEIMNMCNMPKPRFGITSITLTSAHLKRKKFAVSKVEVDLGMN